VVSVDAKKKELIGAAPAYKNAGREWAPKNQPERVGVHDFPNQEPKAVPYGVYDIAKNEGWALVGADHDTAEFAVQLLRRWWERMGQAAYPRARRLLVTADAGGPTVTALGCGRSSSLRWPSRPDCRSPFATSRLGRASGTKSSIGCGAPCQ
jgi:hypothetical protein